MSAPFVYLHQHHKIKIPAAGFGTFMLINPRQTVEHAIDVGYRLFDCAFVYQNEPEIGKAINNKIREGVVSREDLFIIGKLWNTMHHPNDVLPAMQRTLKDLNLKYVDSYLMHWPFAVKKTENEFELLYYEEDDTVTIEDTWRAMEDLLRLEHCRTIGVSNFNKAQLNRILDICEYHPVINEIECNPYLNQKPLTKFCESENIQVVAYAPFWSPESPWVDRSVQLLFTHPQIIELAKKYRKSTAQIILRFLFQLQVIAIPKSDHAENIQTNIDIFSFKLDSSDMKKMEALHTGQRCCPFDTAREFRDYPFRDEY